MISLLSSSLVGRDFLTLRDFSEEEVKKFLWTAMDLKHRIKNEQEVSFCRGIFNIKLASIT